MTALYEIILLVPTELFFLWFLLFMISTNDNKLQNWKSSIALNILLNVL